MFFVYCVFQIGESLSSCVATKTIQAHRVENIQAELNYETVGVTFITSLASAAAAAGAKDVPNLSYRHIWTGGGDGRVKVWDRDNDNELLVSFTQHSQSILISHTVLIASQELITLDTSNVICIWAMVEIPRIVGSYHLTHCHSPKCLPAVTLTNLLCLGHVEGLSAFDISPEALSLARKFAQEEAELSAAGSGGVKTARIHKLRREFGGDGLLQQRSVSPCIGKEAADHSRSENVGRCRSYTSPSIHQSPSTEMVAPPIFASSSQQSSQSRHSDDRGKADSLLQTKTQQGAGVMQQYVHNSKTSVAPAGAQYGASVMTSISASGSLVRDGNENRYQDILLGQYAPAVNLPSPPKADLSIPTSSIEGHQMNLSFSLQGIGGVRRDKREWKTLIVSSCTTLSIVKRLAADLFELSQYEFFSICRAVTPNDTLSNSGSSNEIPDYIVNEQSEWREGLREWFDESMTLQEVGLTQGSFLCLCLRYTYSYSVL